jgi:hypothetical protein
MLRLRSAQRGTQPRTKEAPAPTHANLQPTGEQTTMPKNNVTDPITDQEWPLLTLGQLGDVKV